MPDALFICPQYHTCTFDFQTLPYHTVLGRRGLDLLQTTLRPIRMAQSSPAGKGRKDREYIQVYVVRC